MSEQRTSPYLEGKHGLILGVANKRSVAWACAKALRPETRRWKANSARRFSTAKAGA